MRCHLLQLPHRQAHDLHHRTIQQRMRRWTTACLGVALLAATPLVAQVVAPRPQPQHGVDTASVTPDVIDKGRRLYRGKGACAPCHGVQLEGTPIAPGHRRTSGWKHARDGTIDELVRVIMEGIPGTVMLACPSGINRAEAVLIASYIWAVNHRAIKP
jgi:hypothetical protein